MNLQDQKLSIHVALKTYGTEFHVPQQTTQQIWWWRLTHPLWVNTKRCWNKPFQWKCTMGSNKNIFTITQHNNIIVFDQSCLFGVTIMLHTKNMGILIEHASVAMSAFHSKRSTWPGKANPSFHRSVSVSVRECHLKKQNCWYCTLLYPGLLKLPNIW